MLVGSGETDWKWLNALFAERQVVLCADGDNMMKSVSLLLYDDRSFGSSAPERRFAGGTYG
jgi:hypothetical protein